MRGPEVSRRAAIAGASATIITGAARGQTLTPVSCGTAQTITDAPIFIADKKKYFQEEGLAVTMPGFASAANMVAPLGAGQLDVGGGTVACSSDIALQQVEISVTDASGYTAKVAGTEKGMTSAVESTFSTCFGHPFLPLHPSVYGNMLRDLIAKHNVDCWLVNTGWSGGKYGVGKRMSIQHTRKLISAALDGSLAMSRPPISTAPPLMPVTLATEPLVA